MTGRDHNTALGRWPGLLAALALTAPPCAGGSATEAEPTTPATAAAPADATSAAPATAAMPATAAAVDAPAPSANPESATAAAAAAATAPSASASTTLETPAPSAIDALTMARWIGVGAGELAVVAKLGVPFEIIPASCDTTDFNARLDSDRFFLYQYPDRPNVHLIIGVKSGLCVAVRVWDNSPANAPTNADGDHAASPAPLMTIDDYLRKFPLSTRPHG